MQCNHNLLFFFENNKSRNYEIKGLLLIFNYSFEILFRFNIRLCKILQIFFFHLRIYLFYMIKNNNYFLYLIMNWILLNITIIP